jgi:hypothetical protein
MSNTPKRKPTEAAFVAVEYRLDLAGQRIKPINLGVLMEFVAGNIWTVGTAMLHTVDMAAVEDLDLMSRELIGGRADIIKNEISTALKAARRPGDVLRLLAEHNPWSFHVTPPETVVLPDAKIDTMAVEKVAEKYVLEAYAPRLWPEAAIIEAVRTKEGPLAGVSPAEAPPAWMLPTEFLRAPLTHIRSITSK